VARFFSGLFGNSKQTQPPATALRVNTALQGVPIALILGGSSRLAGNLIDYYNFFYQNAPSGQGGKGGAFAAGTGKGNSGHYIYSSRAAPVSIRRSMPSAPAAATS
jgi:hypothetical protein